jgi:hypothetical protein
MNNQELTKYNLKKLRTDKNDRKLPVKKTKNFWGLQCLTQKQKWTIKEGKSGKRTSLNKITEMFRHIIVVRVNLVLHIQLN